MKIKISILLLFITIAVFASEPDSKNNPQALPVFSENYQRYITTLASDEFEGREPLTPGGIKTEDFIETEFRRIGLHPANNGSYRQEVPVFKTNITNISEFTVSGNDNTVSFTWLDDFTISTQTKAEHVNLEASELVFAGFGITAPEFDWDDYHDVDLNGKTILVLSNDPGYVLQDPDFFNGSNASQFSRTNHKYEQALSRGAAAVFIIHEYGATTVTWSRMQRFATSTRLQLGSTDQKPSLKAQGWINSESTANIFELAGFTWDELHEMALQKDFRAIPLNLSATVSFDIETLAGSDNIAGYIEGSQYPEETVIYMGHWDHLGKRETDAGTVIYNGAIDNATGTAAIMAIAERYVAMDPPPARSVLFLAVTAEESGLLGSRYYVENPLFPLETTVGVINIDMLNVTGPTRDLFLIGYGLSDIQTVLKKHLANQNRVLIADPKPEQQYFRRSDHFNFARLGVPTIFTYGGTDFFGPDKERQKELYEVDDRRYHTPDDIIHDHWNWEGINNNLWIFYHIGKDFANSRFWPQWYDEEPYGEIRNESNHFRNQAP